MSFETTAQVPMAGGAAISGPCALTDFLQRAQPQLDNGRNHFGFRHLKAMTDDALCTSNIRGGERVSIHEKLPAEGQLAGLR